MANLYFQGVCHGASPKKIMKSFFFNEKQN